MLDVALIGERFEALSPHLDERGRRLFAATKAAAAGYGGIAAVSRITGIAASTIGRGLNQLAAPTRSEAGPHPPFGRRPQSAGRDGPETSRRLERAWSSRGARRSDVADCAGLAESRRVAAKSRPCGTVEPYGRGRIAEAAEVQPSGQPQDPRGRQPSRSRCPVRLHQHRGQRRPSRRPSSDLGRHQEKGTRRRLQECRTRVASPRRARRGAGPRLPRSRNWARRSPMAFTISPAMPVG